MIRVRSDRQVLASAASTDRAAAAGLTAEQLVALHEARAVWQRTGILRRAQFTVGLVEALNHPAAAEWDAIFTRTARRRLAKLSGQPPSVSS